jgi:uncharacterized SAM-dependent methyltransferase
MTFEIKSLRFESDSASQGREFRQAVINGLSKERKVLPSWLLFDSRGSEIFKEITRLKGHHPSVCELEIFNTHKQTIANILAGESIQLIDLGAGDGGKTVILLEQLLKNEMNVHYAPIDISEGAIRHLVTSLKPKFKGTSIEVTGLAADYFQGLETLTHDRTKRNLVLFLGATIGNQDYPSAGKFLRRLWGSLNDGDYVIIGFDLMKNPRLLYQAYNDPEGVFQKFNLYMLDRINRELGTDFVESNFVQQAHYNAGSQVILCNRHITMRGPMRLKAMFTVSKSKRFRSRGWTRSFISKRGRGYRPNNRTNLRFGKSKSWLSITVLRLSSTFLTPGSIMSIQSGELKNNYPVLEWYEWTG